MNKRILPVLAVAALLAGCVQAGTWVNGFYVDGPLCTVCYGTRIVQTSYGTSVCAHCNGTGIEPVATVVNTITVIDTWCPPPPPKWHHRPRRPLPIRRPPVIRHAPPRPRVASPRPRATPRVNRAPRPAAPRGPRPGPRPSGRSRPTGRR